MAIARKCIVPRPKPLAVGANRTPLSLTCRARALTLGFAEFERGDWRQTSPAWVLLSRRSGQDSEAPAPPSDRAKQEHAYPPRPVKRCRSFVHAGVSDG